MDAPLPYGKRLLVDELRRSLDKLDKAGDVLDGRLQALLIAASIIVVAAGTLQFAQLSTFQRLGGLFWLVLLAVIALYGYLFNIVLTALHTGALNNPINPNWREFNQRHFGENEDATLDRLIAEYSSGLKPLVDANQRKSQAVDDALKLFAVIVVAMLLLVPVSLLL